MTLKIFISYSHRDEAVLDRLRTHLATLARDEVVETWDDREIRAGQIVDGTIANAHDVSTVFMPIVSPDFLASDYCYEKEMQAALEKAERGEMTIVPVIAEPCDWLSSPLKKFKAVPKDGKPISEWTNANNAYLDIVQELRRVAMADGRKVMAAKPAKGGGSPAASRVKIRRDFSSIDRAKFRDAAYTEIRRYFAESIEEFGQIEGLQGAFEDIDPNAFTCTIVNRSKREAESHLTVRNNKNRQHALGDMTVSFDAYARTETANEIVSVASDDYDQYLELGMRFGGSDTDRRLSAAQVADILWRNFVQRAGIDYE